MNEESCYISSFRLDKVKAQMERPFTCSPQKLTLAGDGRPDAEKRLRQPNIF